jgi:hypothetical protein
MMMIWNVVKISGIPFISNKNDGVDRTAQGDVIERVEGLGEDVGIDGTGLVKWPLKH